jgi:hypothetical protein
MNPKFLRMTATAALVIAAITAPASAQVGLGLTGGVSVSNLDGDDITDADNYTGFSGGAYVNLGLGSALSLEPQLLYTRKGAGSSDGDLTQDFLQIPALLKYSFGAPGTGVRLFVFAGPVFSYAWSCEIDTGDGVDCEDFPDVGSENSTIWSGTAGAGLQFGKLGLDVRYETGLSDTFEDIDAKYGTWTIMGRFALVGS